MPEGSTAYTFKCVVPGVQVTDETPAAAQIAKECGLRHQVVEIFWEDLEIFAPVLMRRKKAPIHSIEAQIYKAALQAKQDGFDTLLFGESADVTYGGLNSLLSKEYTVGEFIERYSFLMPHLALKHPVYAIDGFTSFECDGMIDPHRFVSNLFFCEGLHSYINACKTAGVNLAAPYAKSYLAEPIDYVRIRGGEPKYLVREVYRRLFPDFPIPNKTPMPRPMNEWLKDWKGPVRPEFWPHCAERLNGDQKWLLWILEQYLNLTN